MEFKTVIYLCVIIAFGYVLFNLIFEGVLESRMDQPPVAIYISSSPHRYVSKTSFNDDDFPLIAALRKSGCSDIVIDPSGLYVKYLGAWWRRKNIFVGREQEALSKWLEGQSAEAMFTFNWIRVKNRSHSLREQKITLAPEKMN